MRGRQFSRAGGQYRPTLTPEIHTNVFPRLQFYTITKYKIYKLKHYTFYTSTTLRLAKISLFVKLAERLDVPCHLAIVETVRCSKTHDSNIKKCGRETKLFPIHSHLFTCKSVGRGRE